MFNINRIKLPTYYIDDEKVRWLKQTKRGIKYFHAFRTYELSSDRNLPEQYRAILDNGCWKETTRA